MCFDFIGELDCNGSVLWGNQTRCRAIRAYICINTHTMQPQCVFNDFESVFIASTHHPSVHPPTLPHLSVYSQESERERESSSAMKTRCNNGRLKRQFSHVNSPAGSHHQQTRELQAAQLFPRAQSGESEFIYRESNLSHT